MSGLEPAEIRALARMLDELDYYQILEIDRSAQAPEVKRAFHDSCRRFHPDGHRHLAGDVREDLERIARRVCEAYSVMRDPRRRQAYDQSLASNDGETRMQLAEANARAKRASQEAQHGKTPKGRRLFLQAQADLERDDLAGAARNLQMALTFEPGNALFKQRLEEIREALRSR